MSIPVRHLLGLCALSACALLPQAATAAEEAIATDRPDWKFPGGHSLGVMPGVYMERTDLGQSHVGGVFAAVSRGLSKGTPRILARRWASRSASSLPHP